jgi:hypothetical protein
MSFLTYTFNEITSTITSDTFEGSLLVFKRLQKAGVRKCIITCGIETISLEKRMTAQEAADCLHG